MFTIPGIRVHDALEWMFTFGWNLRSRCPGIRNQTRFWVVVATRMEELVLHPMVKPVQMIAFRQLDSNGTARVGGGHRGVTEIVRSLESTAVGDTGQVSHRARHDDPRVSYTVAVRIL